MYADIGVIGIKMNVCGRSDDGDVDDNSSVDSNDVDIETAAEIKTDRKERIDRRDESSDDDDDDDGDADVSISVVDRIIIMAGPYEIGFIRLQINNQTAQIGTMKPTQPTTIDRKVTLINVYMCCPGNS